MAHYNITHYNDDRSKRCAYAPVLKIERKAFVYFIRLLYYITVKYIMYILEVRMIIDQTISSEI